MQNQFFFFSYMLRDNMVSKTNQCRKTTFDCLFMALLRGTRHEVCIVTYQLFVYNFDFTNFLFFRVWLPVFPREGDPGHTFMSKRIMLHFPLEKFYPLAILFEDAIILGAENDTILFNASNVSTTHLPYCVLERSVSC